MDIQKYILLTIDVEDWFQVENFKPWISFETWDQRELRVEKNTHRILDLFDSIEMQLPSLPASQPIADNYELSDKSFESKCNGQRPTNNRHTKKVRATFFVLGWIAERLPNLVKEIQSRGHEIASHGCNHNLCNQQSHDDLKKELTNSKKILEDITGSPVFGFRAPNFAINNSTLKIIEDCRYLYDSSYNSFSLHRRYGHISQNGAPKIGIAIKFSNNFFELPLSNLQMMSKIIPWGGGAYFRILPWFWFKRGVKYILIKDNVYLFYLHPWEFDPKQPRVNQATALSKFRHYFNIDKSENKLKGLIKEFSYCHFITCSQYLKKIKIPR